MKKTTFSAILLGIIWLQVSGQETQFSFFGSFSHRIIFEGGALFPEGTVKESIPIRQNVNPYAYGDYYQDYSVSAFSHSPLAGLRWELFYPKFKTGLSIGLRYLDFKTSIKSTNYEPLDFYYLRYAINDSEVRFTRIAEITERNAFLTLPLEVICVPLSMNKVDFFIAAGSDIHIARLSAKVNVLFREDNMADRENEVIKGLSLKGTRNFSSFYTRLGIQLGSPDGVKYRVEGSLPMRIISGNPFKMTEFDFILGVRFSIAVPLF